MNSSRIALGLRIPWDSFGNIRGRSIEKHVMRVESFLLFLAETNSSSVEEGGRWAERGNADAVEKEWLWRWCSMLSNQSHFTDSYVADFLNFRPTVSRISG